MKRTALSAAIAAIITLPVSAGEFPYYVTAGVGHTDNEVSHNHFDDHMKHSYTMELSLGYMLKDNVALEGSFVIPSLTQDDSRADVEQFRFNGFYFFSEDALKPYVTAGVGLEEMSAGDTRLSNALLSLGGGVQYDASDRLFGRAEIRYDDMVNEYPEHTTYLVEVGYRFGSSAAAATAAAGAAATNNMTDEPAKATEAAPAQQAPVTADNVNTLPATAAGIAPAPLLADSDKDGVLDTADQCKDSAAGALVDSRGCDLVKEIEKKLKFTTNSDVMPKQVADYLTQLAAKAQSDKSMKIQLTGHADDRGSDEYNMELGAQRAETVRDFLVAKGASKDQIVTLSKGKREPIADNSTEEGKAQNRRVEVEVK